MDDFSLDKGKPVSIGSKEEGLWDAGESGVGFEDYKFRDIRV